MAIFICSKCGKKPPEVLNFRISDQVVCSLCEPGEEQLEPELVSASAVRNARRLLAKVIPRDCHQDKDKCMAFCVGKHDTLWTLIHSAYWTLNEALADGHRFTEEELAP